MREKISCMVKKIKEPAKKTGSSERSMIKYSSKCNNRKIFIFLTQLRKQYEGGPNHEGYERNHYG